MGSAQLQKQAARKSRRIAVEQRKYAAGMAVGKLHKNWKCAWSAREHFHFLCGCYMYNYWGAEQLRAYVSRYDQSAWTANLMTKLEMMHILQNLCAAVLAHTQGCQLATSKSETEN